MLIFFLRAATSPSSPHDSWNRCSFFLLPAAPKNSHFGSMMRLLNPMPSDRSGWPRPPVATSPRTQIPPPIFRSRSTPCFSPLSIPLRLSLPIVHSAHPPLSVDSTPGPYGHPRFTIHTALIRPRPVRTRAPVLFPNAQRRARFHRAHARRVTQRKDFTIANL